MPQNKYAETPYVRDGKSYGENLLTREQHPTDGNMMGFEEMYGQGGADMGQLQHMPIDATVKRFRDLYGDEQAIMVLDELVRIQEKAGGGLRGRAPSTLSEVESYGLARRHPTDGNLMGHEKRFGYPPSVAQYPAQGQTPFRQQQPQQPQNVFQPPAGRR